MVFLFGKMSRYFNKIIKLYKKRNLRSFSRNDFYLTQQLDEYFHRVLSAQLNRMRIYRGMIWRARYNVCIRSHGESITNHPGIERQINGSLMSNRYAPRWEITGKSETTSEGSETWICAFRQVTRAISLDWFTSSSQGTAVDRGVLDKTLRETRLRKCTKFHYRF